MSRCRLAIFASGSGTNAENIIRYFKDHPSIDVNVVLANRPTAGVLKRAEGLKVPTIVFNKQEFREPGYIVKLLKEREVDMIILAGFLWLIPATILSDYDKRIVNIHPALLPAFGGKGMYGDAVHQAVLANGEWRSGITIHVVNEAYDEGAILFQQGTLIKTNDTPLSLAQRIHELEYQYYPQVIKSYVNRIIFNKSKA